MSQRGCLVALMAAVLVSACSSGSSTADVATTTAATTGANATLSVTQEQSDAANRFTNGATQYGDLTTRICAASTLLKLFDVKRLDELTAGAVPTAADAEKLYNAFAPCRSLNVLIQAFQSAVVGLTIDQSRCINAEGPTLADSKPFVMAALQQTTAPVVPDAIKVKLNNAATKCLTAAQRTAMGFST